MYFKVEHLSCGKAKDISFSLHRGEILGLFGLMGAGRTSVVRGIFGDAYVREGHIEMNGTLLRNNSPQDAIRHKIAYVPNERKVEGLMLSESVCSNISISVIGRLMKHFKIDSREEKKMSDQWIKRLGIRTPSGETKVETLSGGNQQKVVIARWLDLI